MRVQLLNSYAVMSEAVIPLSSTSIHAQTSSQAKLELEYHWPGSPTPHHVLALHHPDEKLQYRLFTVRKPLLLYSTGSSF